MLSEGGFVALCRGRRPVLSRNIRAEFGLVKPLFCRDGDGFGGAAGSDLGRFWSLNLAGGSGFLWASRDGLGVLTAGGRG